MNTINYDPHQFQIPRQPADPEQEQHATVDEAYDLTYEDVPEKNRFDGNPEAVTTTETQRMAGEILRISWEIKRKRANTIDKGGK